MGKKLKILVSSTVYGIEELLELVYTLLTHSDYEVWMSHKGTVPVNPNCSAFDNCLNAIDNCDLFLGLITPHYGSGQDGDDPSITHMELRKAIELNKPRWLLVHENVVFARLLLENLGYSGAKGREKLTLKKNPIIDDLRVIDMYEEAILSQRPLRDRQGNWVQKFRSPGDATLFATAQFSRYQEVEAFVEENLKDHSAIAKIVQASGERS